MLKSQATAKGNLAEFRFTFIVKNRLNAEVRFEDAIAKRQKKMTFEEKTKRHQTRIRNLMKNVHSFLNQVGEPGICCQKRTWLKSA